MSLPNEVFCDVLAYFSRLELDRLAMISRRFRGLILRHFANRPTALRPPLRFYITFYPMDDYGCCLEAEGQKPSFGTIQQFYTALEQRVLVPISGVRITICSGFRVRHRHNQHPLTDEAKSLLSRLRPTWQQCPRSSINVSCSSTQDNCNMDILKMVLQWFQPPADYPTMTMPTLRIHFNHQRRRFRYHQPKIDQHPFDLARINADAEITALMARPKCEITVYFHFVTLQQMPVIDKFCRANTIKHITVVSENVCDSMLEFKQVPDVFDAMKSLYPNIMLRQHRDHLIEVLFDSTVSEKLR